MGKSLDRPTALAHIRKMLTKLGPAVSEEHTERVMYRAALPEPKFYAPVLLDILRGAMGLEDHGPYEKVRWVVDFAWDKHPYSIALEKFGLRLYTPFPRTDETNPHAGSYMSAAFWQPSANLEHPVTAELLRKLLNAQSIAERGLADLAQKQCDQGNATVANVYWGLRSQYDFLRAEALRHYKRKPPKPKDIKDSKGEVVGRTIDLHRPERHGGYLAGAAVHAYFSLLEHLMILILPFTQFDPSGGKLTEMIGANWGVKVAAAIDLTEHTAKGLFEELKAIKDGLRNPLSHGGFGTRNTSLFFHLPGIAAVPMTMRAHKAVFRPFGRTIMALKDFDAACDLFDRFDRYLENSPARYGYRYARSGLDVDFSENGRKRYAMAASDDETFDSFLEYEGHQYDRHTNMDY